MTQMENRIVLCRFKDGYGPVGAYFLHLKTYTQNANGENYEKKWYDQTKELVGEYIDHHPTPTFRDRRLGKFFRYDSWASCCLGFAKY
jgi:adenylylsulfate reductase subunit A